MTALNEFDMGATRIKQAFNGVVHWYGTDRAALIIQTNNGVFERLRNAYYHDYPGREQYFLLDSSKPAWMERIRLDGGVEDYYAPATNDDTTAPTWTLVALMESTRHALYHDLEITGDVVHTGNYEQTGTAKRTGDTELIGKLSSTDQYINTVEDGTTPMLITSTTKVTNLNVEQVDGLDANATPTANTLLPLDQNAKFPNSVINTGTGNGLDADQLDGKEAADFMLATPDATIDWFAVTANSTSGAKSHGLNAYPRMVIIQFRPTGSTNPTQVIYPAANTQDNYADVTSIFFSDANNIKVKTGSYSGLNGSGTNTANGDYKILLWK